MYDPFDKKIGEALKSAREQAGYTQVAFADLLGWKYKTYQNYEIGKSSLSLTQAREIADALECPLDLIFKDVINSEHSVDEIPEAIKDKICTLTEEELNLLVDFIDLLIAHRNTSH